MGLRRYLSQSLTTNCYWWESIFINCLIGQFGLPPAGSSPYTKLCIVLERETNRGWTTCVAFTVPAWLSIPDCQITHHSCIITLHLPYLFVRHESIIHPLRPFLSLFYIPSLRYNECKEWWRRSTSRQKGTWSEWSRQPRPVQLHQGCLSSHGCSPAGPCPGDSSWACFLAGRALWVGGFPNEYALV